MRIVTVRCSAPVSIAIDGGGSYHHRYRMLFQARRPIVYLAATGAALAAFMSVRACGESLEAPMTHADRIAATTMRTSPHALLHVLLALAVVILVARIAAIALGRLNQAPVIGEVLAGIVLGPSLLGQVAPAAS